MWVHYGVPCSKETNWRELCGIPRMIQIDIREYKENIKGDTLNLLTTHEICLPIASFFKLRKPTPRNAADGQTPGTGPAGWGSELRPVSGLFLVVLDRQTRSRRLGDRRTVAGRGRPRPFCRSGRTLGSCRREPAGARAVTDPTHCESVTAAPTRAGGQHGKYGRTQSES